MDGHVFVVFCAIFCATLFQTIQGFPFTFEATLREKRSPQDNGLTFQTSGSLNLRGLNLPQVANNVRKHLHDLIDTVTNPLNVQIITQVEPADVNYEYEQYDYVDQQYQNPPPGPPPGPPPRGPPHRHRPRGPPHGPPPRGPPHGPPPRGPPHGPPGGPPHWGPPHGHPPGGPPHGHPPGGPPHGHPPGGPPRGPPYGHGPPDFPGPPGRPDDFDGYSDQSLYENSNENLPENRPGFDKQPNYPGRDTSTVNIDLSASHPTTKSTNLDEKDTEPDSNVVGYIDDNFPVILLNENEIR